MGSLLFDWIGHACAMMSIIDAAEVVPADVVNAPRVGVVGIGRGADVLDIASNALMHEDI